MAFDIIDAVEPGIREDVFRFRYDVYVREMGRTQKDADHDRGRIEDALDSDAVLLAARHAITHGVAGTVRANLAGGRHLGLYEDVYGLWRLSGAERRVASITTRMMIERRLRKSPLALNLALALFERGLDRGVEIDFIDCNDHLVAFFEHLGYRRVGPIGHPDYGRVTLMRLDVHDLAHFRRVGSPFAGVHERRMRVA